MTAVTSKKEQILRFVELIKREAERGSMLPADYASLAQSEVDGEVLVEAGEDGTWRSIAVIYPGDKCVEIGAVITDPECRGRGYATRVVTQAILRAEESFPDLPIIAMTNEASTGLFQKLGFREHDKGTVFPELQEPCRRLCPEWDNWPNCHCHYLVQKHLLAMSSKGVLHMIVQDPEDKLEEIARLYCQVWAEPPWDEYEWDFLEVVRELRKASADPATIFLAGRVAGEIVGFTIGYPMNREELAEKCGSDQLDYLFRDREQLFYVAELGVEKGSRRDGTGSLLSGQLLSKAEVRGFKRFVLRTDVEADPAKALYAKLGFVDTGIVDGEHSARTYWVREA